MSNTGALDLASNIGGIIKHNVDDVLSAVDKYGKYHVCYGGKEDDRKSNYTDMVNEYYDLVTRLYEFGWGESFHFAHRWKGESFRESIKRHEQFLALQLGLKPRQKVLDVGCGIGGPLREIARFRIRIRRQFPDMVTGLRKYSGSNAVPSTSITGLNNNEYQIARGKELIRIAGVDKTCSLVKADFMKMPFPDNSFDAIYAIEATCHAPDVVGCYREIYRVLKPGQHFAVHEWCMTDAFDPNNQEHQKIKKLRSVTNFQTSDRQDTATMLLRKQVLRLFGIEILQQADSPIPWYSPVETNNFSFISFRLSAVGCFVTKHLVSALEFIRLAPNGSLRIQYILEKAAQGLVEGGKRKIFTPMYFFLVLKPVSR